MPKLHRPYKSPAWVLKDLSPRLFKALYSKADYYVLKRQEHFPLSKDFRNYSHIERAGEQFVGALQPVIDMWRDVIKTFQPYRSKSHVIRDFLQPLRGVVKIMSGLASLVFGTLTLFLGMSIIIISTVVTGGVGYDAVQIGMVIPASWMLNGVLEMVRGAAQIMTTPLTWLLKTPLRAVLTAIFGYRKVMEREGVKALFQLANNPHVANCQFTKKMIHRKLYQKFLKAENEGAKLPAGLNLHNPANARDFCFSFAKDYQDSTILREVVPREIKPYVDIAKFRQLSTEKRTSVLYEMRALKERVFGLDANQKQRLAIEILQRDDLYDLQKLLLLSHKPKDSTLRVIPKDVIKLFAAANMHHDDVNISENTPLLRAN